MDVEKEVQKLIEESIINDEGRRYHRKSGQNTSRLIWNIYNLEDPIISGDGFLIHHIDGNKLNDVIENYQKSGVYYNERNVFNR